MAGWWPVEVCLWFQPFSSILSGGYSHLKGVYGYLVTFELSDVLMDEVKRLNQAFGIGIIRLSGNPFEHEIVLPAQYKELDFITIDKLCKINPDFERCVEQVEKYITADARYISALNKELINFCDPFFTSETESATYCRERNIPLDKPFDENLPIINQLLNGMFFIVRNAGYFDYGCLVFPGFLPFPKFGGAYHVPGEITFMQR